MEEPREIDIDTFQCPEELLESIEDLQYKVEELQVYCQESEKKNAELQQLLIEKERDCKKRLNVSSEELSKLRETKVRIVKENVMKGISNLGLFIHSLLLCLVLLHCVCFISRCASYQTDVSLLVWHRVFYSSEQR